MGKQICEEALPHSCEKSLSSKSAMQFLKFTFINAQKLLLLLS